MKGKVTERWEDVTPKWTDPGYGDHALAYHPSVKRRRIGGGVITCVDIVDWDGDGGRDLLLSAWGTYGDTPFSPDKGGGIYLSSNGGKSWTMVLGDPHIGDLSFDRENGRYYAAGGNSSAYVSADRGRSWKRIPGYNFKWGKSVVPDPADRNKVYITTYGGGLWHGPVNGGRHPG